MPRMKHRLRLLPLLLVLLMTPVNPAAQVPAAREPLTVMSFNIRYGTAQDGDNHWTARRDQLFDLVRAQNADVIGVQEALDSQIREITAAAPGYAVVGVGRDDAQAKGEYSAILFRTDRLHVAESGTFWFSDTPEVPASKSWGNNITRICTWARFIDRDGRGFWHFNLHLDHQSQPSRERSTELLRRRIDARAVSTRAGRRHGRLQRRRRQPRASRAGGRRSDGRAVPRHVPRGPPRRARRRHVHRLQVRAGRTGTRSTTSWSSREPRSCRPGSSAPAAAIAIRRIIFPSSRACGCRWRSSSFRTRGEHERTLAGLPVRGASARQEPRRHRHHGLYAGAGHRRDHGDLQRRLRRVAAAAAVPRFEPDHGGLRGQLEGQAVAPCGPELRRLSRSEPQLPGDCEVQRQHRVRFGSVAADAHDGCGRLARLSRGLRCSADPRAGFQRRRREERGRPHRSRQLWILEAVSRIAAGSLAVAPED